MCKKCHTDYTQTWKTKDSHLERDCEEAKATYSKVFYGDFPELELPQIQSTEKVGRIDIYHYSEETHPDLDEVEGDCEKILKLFNLVDLPSFGIDVHVLSIEQLKTIRNQVGRRISIGSRSPRPYKDSSGELKFILQLKNSGLSARTIKHEFVHMVLDLVGGNKYRFLLFDEGLADVIGFYLEDFQDDGILSDIPTHPPKYAFIFPSMSKNYYNKHPDERYGDFMEYLEGTEKRGKNGLISN